MQWIVILLSSHCWLVHGLGPDRIFPVPRVGCQGHAKGLNSTWIMDCQAIDNNNGKLSGKLQQTNMGEKKESKRNSSSPDLWVKHWASPWEFNANQELWYLLLRGNVFCKTSWPLGLFIKANLPYHPLEFWYSARYFGILENWMDFLRIKHLYVNRLSVRCPDFTFNFTTNQHHTESRRFFWSRTTQKNATQIAR